MGHPRPPGRVDGEVRPGEGRKLFALLTPAGMPDPMGTGYSRRRLEERPNMDRNVVGVSFEKAPAAPRPTTTETEAAVPTQSEGESPDGG